MNSEALQRIANTIESRLQRDNYKSEVLCKDETTLILRTPQSFQTLRDYLSKGFLYNGVEYTVSQKGEETLRMNSAQFDCSPGFYEYTLQVRKAEP